MADDPRFGPVASLGVTITTAQRNELALRLWDDAPDTGVYSETQGLEAVDTILAGLGITVEEAPCPEQ